MQCSNGDLAHPTYATCLGARCGFHCIAPPNLHLTLHLLLLSWDVSFNPGPTRHTVKKCRVLCANIRGLHCNLTDLVGVATECDVLVLSETLVSTRRHSAELLVPGFEKPYLKFSEVNLVSGAPVTRDIATYVRSGYHATRIENLECSCHEMLVVRVFGRLLLLLLIQGLSWRPPARRRSP